MGAQALRRRLDGARKLEKPELPVFRRVLTLADEIRAANPTER